MRVLLSSHGSTGDIYPVIALGRALQDAGHIVNFASAPLYQDIIKKAGLGFIDLPPNWDQSIFAECMRELDRQANPIHLLRQIYKSGLPFMSELIDKINDALDHHDVLIGSYLFPHMGILADRKGIPFATTTFCHSVVPNPDCPPDFIPRLSILPKAINRKWSQFWWKTSNAVVDFAINGIIKDALRAKGLPKMKNFILGPADCCLVTVSKSLMKPKGEIDPRFHYTGFMRWQSPRNDIVAKELEDFCQGEEVPVLNFGSVSFDNTQAVMKRFEKHWPTGRKIIIQSGWAGLSVSISRPEFKMIGNLSHDQLFQFASVVIHHGGAGTTASVFHAGKPQIVVPHFGDQAFWANEVKRLKTGISIPQHKWPERLPKAVNKVLNQSKYRIHAESCAYHLSKENGPKNAVYIIEQLVKNHSAQT